MKYWLCSKAASWELVSLQGMRTEGEASKVKSYTLSRLLLSCIKFSLPVASRHIFKNVIQDTAAKHLAFWNRHSKTYCSHECKWSGRKPGWFVLFARHHTCWRAGKQKLHALSLQTRCQRSASHPLSRGCWIERECSKVVDFLSAN